MSVLNFDHRGRCLRAGDQAVLAVDDDRFAHIKGLLTVLRKDDNRTSNVEVRTANGTEYSVPAAALRKFKPHVSADLSYSAILARLNYMGAKP